MCIVCALYEKDKLKASEAIKGLWELVEDPDLDKQHLKEVYGKFETLARKEREDGATT